MSFTKCQFLFILTFQAEKERKKEAAKKKQEAKKVEEQEQKTNEETPKNLAVQDMPQISATSMEGLIFWSLDKVILIELCDRYIPCIVGKPSNTNVVVFHEQ